MISIARVAGSEKKRRGGTRFAFHGLAPEATAKRPVRGFKSIEDAGFH